MALPVRPVAVPKAGALVVRRAHRKNILLAIIIGILFSAVVVAVILFQNRNPF